MSNVFNINNKMIRELDNPEKFEDIRKILDIFTGKSVNDVIADLICIISIVLAEGLKRESDKNRDDAVKMVHKNLDRQIRLHRYLMGEK